MTIRMKIMGGLALIAVIGLLFGVVGMVSTNMLTSQSDELYQLQQTGSSISSVLNSHYTWRHALTEAVLTNTEFTGSTDSTTCSFGKWLADVDGYNITDSEVLSTINQLKTPHANIHSGAEKIKGMMAAGDLEGAKAELEGVLLPLTAQVIDGLTSMESGYQKIISDKSGDIAATGNQMTILLIILTAFMIVIAAVLSITITQSIMKPLSKITDAAEKIAVGDLDVSVQYSVNDHIGNLVNSFNKLIDSTKKQIVFVEAMAAGDLTARITPRSNKDAMSIALSSTTQSLNEMFAEIRSSATQVSMGSRQIAHGAQSLAQGSTEQASTVDQLSSTISEISTKTQQNAEIAREASRLSESIKSNAEKGSAQMGQMMQAVQEINDASGKIEKVIRVIDDIASQTNILALNAAVEAARAGAAGKGFAVVAEEVRNLAAKSAEAAKDTGKLIEDSVAKADMGMGIATETSYSLKEIVDGINRSSDIVGRIAQSSEEQASAISIVNTGIDQVAHVVQLNSATAQESAAASQEMSGQSDLLEQLISRFKVKDGLSAPQTSSSKRSINPPNQPRNDFNKFDKY